MAASPADRHSGSRTLDPASARSLVPGEERRRVSAERMEGMAHHAGGPGREGGGSIWNRTLCCAWKNDPPGIGKAKVPKVPRP